MPVVPIFCGFSRGGSMFWKTIALWCRDAGIVGALAFLLHATACGGAPMDAEVLLQREKGLTRIAGGNVWLSTAELRLRDHVGRLPDLERNTLTLRRALDERIQNNAKLWETNRRRIQSLRQAMSATDTDDPKRTQIETQIKELESQAVEPRRLPAEANVRLRLIEMTNLRTQLGLSVIAIRRLKPEMEAEYKRLAGDSELTSALGQLGPSHRLGPMNNGYATEIRRLIEYERVAFTDWSPGYIQSGKVRVGGILNERTPVAFTGKESSDPTVLAASVVEAAGLGVADSAEVVVIPFGRSRRLATRRLVVPTIRFGSHVLKTVPAYVLPPEGEDLGSRIGPEAFGERRATVEPELLRLVIRASTVSDRK